MCTGPEPTNGLLTTRIAVRDIIRRCEGAEKGPREGSVSKGECKQKEHYRLNTMVLIVARYSIVKRKKETHLVKI